MVHHEIDGHERLDDFRVLLHSCDGGSHRREIHQQRDTREILQDDARDDERDFLLRRRLAFQFASVRTSRSVTFLPSTLRRTDSSTMRMLIGSREILPTPAASSAGSE